MYLFYFINIFPPFLAFFFSSFFSSALAHPSPQPFPSEPVPFVPLTNLTDISDAHCASAPAYLPFRRISIANCISAIRQFPNDSVPGVFHTLPPDDEYLLPQSHPTSDCQVTVDLLQEGHSVRSNWREIRAAALELLYICRVENDPSKTKGGNARTAAGDAIKITIKKKGILGGSHDKGGGEGEGTGRQSV